MLNCPGEGTLRAQAHLVAVGGDALEAVPVFEIPQLAGVDFVDDFPLAVGAVAAAPEPVFAFDDKIHDGQPPAEGDGGVPKELPLQQAGHHQVVGVPGGDDALGGHLLRRTGDGDPIPLPEGGADAGMGEPEIGFLHAHPHSGALGPLQQHRRLLGGIQPEGHVGWILGLLRLAVGRQQRFSAGCGGCEGHSALGGEFRLQIAEIREIQGVDVLFIREDNDIGPHGNHPFGAVRLPLRQTHFHLIPIHHEFGAVHPAQAVSGNQALGVGRMPVYAPLFPGGEQGIVVGAHVLHGGKFPGTDAAACVIAFEYR